MKRMKETEEKIGKVENQKGRKKMRIGRGKGVKQNETKKKK